MNYEWRKASLKEWNAENAEEQRRAKLFGSKDVSRKDTEATRGFLDAERCAELVEVSAKEQRVAKKELTQRALRLMIFRRHFRRLPQSDALSKVEVSAEATRGFFRRREH